MSNFMDKAGLSYFWNKIKVYISGQLSNKQDKLTGQAGQTVVFDSSGNLVPSSGGSSSASSISFDYSISDFPSDINTVQEALDYLSSLNLLIGTKITILASGSWVCPATGQWGLELHGGGGAGARGDSHGSEGEYGLGSGNYQIVSLTKGSNYSIVIGEGGEANYEDYGETGGTTSFGNYSVNGGAGGGSSSNSSGNISDERYGSTDHSQPYGNGGDADYKRGYSGSRGAVILTYLG